MLRFLVVDDEKPQRDKARSVIQELGHITCAQAKNGIEAIAKAKSESPDVVLLDVAMREMTGVEAAFEIAQLDNPPKIIFVSNMAQLFLREACAKLNAQMVVKPYAAAQLARAIQNLEQPDTSLEGIDP